MAVMISSSTSPEKPTSTKDELHWLRVLHEVSGRGSNQTHQWHRVLNYPGRKMQDFVWY